VKTAVDPRITARRTQVRETWARRRLRWIVALLALVIGVGIGNALVQSPWLALRTVEVFGAVHAPVDAILARQNVVAGVPTLSVRPSLVEEALERNPWVAAADVHVTWPGTVEVSVIERVPAGWLNARSGWVLVAADGVAVARGAPVPGEPVVRAQIAELAPGQAVDDAEVTAAFVFLALLPPEMAVGATVRTSALGLEATVAGHRIMLGNRRDMEAKTATVVAMLEAGVSAGATLNVVSPSRPALSNPGLLVEGTREDASVSDDTG